MMACLARRGRCGSFATSPAPFGVPQPRSSASSRPAAASVLAERLKRRQHPPARVSSRGGNVRRPCAVLSMTMLYSVRMPRVLVYPLAAVALVALTVAGPARARAALGDAVRGGATASGRMIAQEGAFE